MPFDRLDCLAYYFSMIWQLQIAKNKLSEVVETSLTQGAQIISRRGKATAVIMSYKKYIDLTKPKKDLKHLLLHSGFHELDLTRDRSTGGRATETTFGFD